MNPWDMPEYYITCTIYAPPPPYIQEENIEIPDGTTIYEPENLNYQEVWFNNKFSFTQHIDILTCKIGQIL